MRRHRIGLMAALAAMAMVVGAGVLAAPSAQAATPQAHLTLADPLSIDPVRLQVAASDVDGWGTAFTGTVTLTAGKTTVTVPVSSTTGQTAVSVPTTTLAGGPVKAVAALQVAGRTVRTTVIGLIDLPSTAVIRGFGCGVVTPATPGMYWQVAALNGTPVTFPAWTPAANTFPAYIHTVKPGTITDSQGQPLATKGSVVVKRGAATVATVALGSSVRRLLFSAPWNGKVKGKLAPGTYAATITLTDTYGRTTTGTQSVIVAKTTTGLCL